MGAGTKWGLATDLSFPDPLSPQCLRVPLWQIPWRAETHPCFLGETTGRRWPSRGRQLRRVFADTHKAVSGADVPSVQTVGLGAVAAPPPARQHGQLP